MRFIGVFFLFSLTLIKIYTSDWLTDCYWLIIITELLITTKQQAKFSRLSSESESIQIFRIKILIFFLKQKNKTADDFFAFKILLKLFLEQNLHTHYTFYMSMSNRILNTYTHKNGHQQRFTHTILCVCFSMYQRNLFNRNMCRLDSSIICFFSQQIFLLPDIVS